MKKDLIEINNGEKEKSRSKFIEILNKKWLKKGLTTALLVLIIIAIYVVINMALDKFTLPEFDLTSDKLYSLSEETKTKLKNIEKEVNILIINNEAIYQTAEKYMEINKNIKVENITNLNERTDLMTEYSEYLQDATSSLILVKSNDKEKVVSEYDLFTYDYTTYQEIDLTEEALTNAIIDVTIDEKPKSYFMTNHTKYASNNFSTLLGLISNDANEVNPLDILTVGNIPEDCDCLIITTLKEDITELERDKIIEYIANGGEILMLCGPNIDNVNLTNFQTVLDQYGINISNGIVFEESSSNILSGYNDCIISEVNSSSSLTSNINMSMNLALIDSGKITFNEENLENLGVEYEEIATTTENAFLRTNFKIVSTNKTDSDEKVENGIIAAIATKTIEGKQSKLIIFANEIFVSDANIPLSSDGYYVTTAIQLYNNKDLALNSIAYLTEREDLITIRKQTEATTYTATQEQHYIIMAIIFILPVLIIILGIVIYVVRRRKK